MDTQEYEEGLRWRLEILKIEIEEGKLHFADHLLDDFRRSLAAIKYDLDGKIDLSSVDGRVRALAAGVAGHHNREAQKKSISLEEISSMYFEYIEKNLGFFIDEARENKYDAHDFAVAVSNSPSLVEDIAPQIPNFLEGLEELWTAVVDASHYHIQDLSSTKAVFGGDLFPSYQKNIASSSGLYVDTIVLSDPFWHSKQILLSSRHELKVYFLVKHAINLMQYKELALASLEKPIVIVTPFKSSVDEDEAEFLHKISGPDALLHAQSIFGREFETVEALFDFTADLDTPEKLVQEVVDNDRLLFDVDWDGSKVEQLQRALEREESEIACAGHPGNLVAMQCLGRMAQATDVLLKSRYLSGTALIDAPTSWQYFNWKLEYNSALADDQTTNLHMVRGLQNAANTEMQWLGNIPPVALIEMRKEGAFEEIRDALSKGVQSLAEANSEDFSASSGRVISNINSAFEEHQKNISDLTKKKWKFAGSDIGSWVVAGTLEVTAIATGLPAFGAAAFAVNQVVDAPSLREIPSRFRNLRNAHIELKKSPMGLLFAHKR